MSKERPILFSAPMVRALLDGSKTQTRRAVKEFPLELLAPDNFTPEYVALPENGFCPYGKPGDRLWVRETWRTTGDGGRADYLAPRDMQPSPVWCDADGAAPAEECTGKTRVSIHMPRWASRILLEIVSVRVELLNECSEADARAEGAKHYEPASHLSHGGWSHDEWQVHETVKASFEKLWERINGAGSWAANPWVWVVEFKRVAP